MSSPMSRLICKTPCLPEPKWNEMKVSQSCPTLCDPMDYTVHGILQPRILEWVAILFSRGSFWPTDPTQVSHIAGSFFIVWITREVSLNYRGRLISKESNCFLHFTSLKTNPYQMYSILNFSCACHYVIMWPLNFNHFFLCHVVLTIHSSIGF